MEVQRSFSSVAPSRCCLPSLRVRILRDLGLTATADQIARCDSQLFLSAAFPKYLTSSFASSEPPRAEPAESAQYEA